MSNIEDLLKEVDSLRALLESPQPGLITWWNSTAKQIAEISEYGGQGETPPLEKKEKIVVVSNESGEVVYIGDEIPRRYKQYYGLDEDDGLFSVFKTSRSNIPVDENLAGYVYVHELLSEEE
jgi:hypothetical protein